MKFYRAQSVDMISTLSMHGADVNLADGLFHLETQKKFKYIILEDGNSPLLLTVRESPINWYHKQKIVLYVLKNIYRKCINMLILFGARYKYFDFISFIAR